MNITHKCIYKHYLQILQTGLYRWEEAEVTSKDTSPAPSTLRC